MGDIGDVDAGEGGVTISIRDVIGQSEEHMREVINRKAEGISERVAVSLEQMHYGTYHSPNRERDMGFPNCHYVSCLDYPIEEPVLEPTA